MSKKSAAEERNNYENAMRHSGFVKKSKVIGVVGGTMTKAYWEHEDGRQVNYDSGMASWVEYGAVFFEKFDQQPNTRIITVDQREFGITIKDTLPFVSSSHVRIRWDRLPSAIEEMTAALEAHQAETTQPDYLYVVNHHAAAPPQIIRGEVVSVSMTPAICIRYELTNCIDLLTGKQVFGARQGITSKTWFVANSGNVTTTRNGRNALALLRQIIRDRLLRNAKRFQNYDSELRDILSAVDKIDLDGDPR